jgi:hypothetical protein
VAGPADESVWPHFTRVAPALLGFDETIDEYCWHHGGRRNQGHSGACVNANVNILSLYVAHRVEPTLSHMDMAHTWHSTPPTHTTTCTHPQFLTFSPHCTDGQGAHPHVLDAR